MKLKDIKGKIKVGDVIWLRIKISKIDKCTEEDIKKGIGENYYSTEESFPNSCLDSKVYENTEILLGEQHEDIREIESIKEVPIENKFTEGQLSVYKQLFDKKISIN